MGQNKALDASFTVKNFAFLIFAFSVWSASIFPYSLSRKVARVLTVTPTCTRDFETSTSTMILSYARNRPEYSFVCFAYCHWALTA